MTCLPLQSRHFNDRLVKQKACAVHGIYCYSEKIQGETCFSNTDSTSGASLWSRGHSHDMGRGMQWPSDDCKPAPYNQAQSWGSFVRHWGFINLCCNIGIPDDSKCGKWWILHFFNPCIIICMSMMGLAKDSGSYGRLLYLEHKSPLESTLTTWCGINLWCSCIQCSRQPDDTELSLDFKNGEHNCLLLTFNMALWELSIRGLQWKGPQVYAACLWTAKQFKQICQSCTTLQGKDCWCRMQILTLSIQQQKPSLMTCRSW